jgi:hypothetical protein
MTPVNHGKLFAVPLPDGTFLCGRVMLDIYGCVKRRLFPQDSPLSGLGKAYLIEMYSAVVPKPVYSPSPILIAGAFVESQEVGKSWPIIGDSPIDPRRVEFPEGLLIYMHTHGQVAFQCGEIHLPVPLSDDDLEGRIAERICRHSAYLWPYTCLRTLGRESEVPVDYKMASLSGGDLRLSPFREEVYQNLPFSMEESYFQKQSKMGLHLERLYE